MIGRLTQLGPGKFLSSPGLFLAATVRLRRDRGTDLIRMQP